MDKQARIAFQPRRVVSIVVDAMRIEGQRGKAEKHRFSGLNAPQNRPALRRTVRLALLARSDRGRRVCLAINDGLLLVKPRRALD